MSAEWNLLQLSRMLSVGAQVLAVDGIVSGEVAS